MLKRGFQFAPGYRLQEFLGRGQFGQVWRATAPGGAASAAKFIDLSDGQGQKEYEGVKRVKQIRHANLMPITAIWLLDGQGKVIEEAPDESIETIDLTVAEARGQSAVYRPEVEPSWLVVAMLLGGQSLQHRLRECIQEGLPGIPTKELISYMDESAKGIDFLNSPQHDLGEGPIAIQHSDIKPANIVLIGSSAVVCDFGLARILTRNQVTATSAAGTPAYMAPEAISGKPSRTSDQYSLAVTYYHLRTGNLPVSDGSLWEVLDAHRQGNLKLGLVPEGEQEVLRKATDLKWENRFDTNVEMVDALREALRVGGHTKPSFVPKSVGLAPAVAIGDTTGVKGDPTATIDLPATAMPDPALQATEPFVPSEQSTRAEGFVQETLPELDEKPATPEAETESFVDSIKHNPKWIVGVGAGAVVLLFAGLMALRPSTDATPSDLGDSEDDATSEVVDVKPDEDSVPIVDADPLVLRDEAMALLDSDEMVAIAKFQSALELDPGIAPEMLERAGHKDSIMTMLETPDGSMLLTFASDPEPYVWDLKTGGSVEPTRLKGREKPPYTSSLSPSGERLLIGGADAVTHVWNLRDLLSSPLRLEGHDNTMIAAIWHPTEPVVVTAAEDKNLGIWTIGPPNDANPIGTITGQRLEPVNEMLTAFAFDSTGNWLAARTVGTNLLEAKVDVLVYSWQEMMESSGAPIPKRLDSPRAKRIGVLEVEGKSLVAVGETGGGIELYDASSGKFVTSTTAHQSGDVEAMRIVRVDGRGVVVTGSDDGSVNRWEYSGSSKSLRRELCPYGIGCVDVSSDGRWVAAGGNNGTVWLWDTSAKDKKLGAVRFATGANSVDSVLIDVKGQWLIAGCDDGVVRVWDLSLAKLLALTRPTVQEKIDDTLEVNTLTPLSMR